MQRESSVPLSRNQPLHIALGAPEWGPLQDVMNGQPVDATYVIQGNLAQGLLARGHRLTYAAPCSTEDFVFTSDPGKARIGARTWSASLPFDLAGKAAWQVQKRLGIPYLNVFSNYRFKDAALMSLRGVDVVYERNGLYNAGLALAARRLRIPYVMFFEADQIMELELLGRPLTGALRWRAETILRSNLRAADCIICVTEAGMQHLVSKWRVPGSKVLVFPNAVHVEKFKPDPQARERMRGSLGISGQPMVIFVGNFFQWHDVNTLLEAFAQTRKDCPDARLVLVGDGERRAEMAERAAGLGLAEAAHFTGIVPHSEVPDYMAAADIAVVPYPPMQQENWLSPLKLFEYMSSGKAVVASAVGQINDVIRDAENGLLVQPGDADGMARALIRLIKDPSLASAMGHQARADALEKFSWDSYLARLERVFHAVMAHEPVETL